MRARLAVFASLAGLTLAAAGWSAAAPVASPAAAPAVTSAVSWQLAQRNAAPSATVDVELVLAVDVSYSMDPDEQALQREGYTAALTSPEFLKALRNGLHGKVAITYVEWAGMHHREVIVPWRLIDGPESADAFAADIMRAPYRRASRTSISGALLFGAEMFKSSPHRGLRRVIDVSGDGVNNNGPLVEITRDEVLAQGITINGLPIMLKRPSYSTMDVSELDIYYEDCVIGGAGAFVIPIREREQFKEATRTKLVLEIASVAPEAQVIPAQAKKPRVPCSIGEQIWRDRWGN